jgi:glutathione S-transferase
MPPKRAAPAKVTLHEMPLSHHCVKAAKLLDLKGVKFERKYVPYHDKRELLKASGQDYVPWLQWGDKGVPWYDIVDFVEAQVPQPTAFPEGRRGEARIVEQWAHDILEEVVWRYVVPDVVATFSDEHERWVFEEMQIRRRGPLEAMKARQPEFLADVKKHVGLVELALERSEFLLGDAPSLADVAVYGALSPIAYVGKELPRESKRTREWYARVGKL